MTLASRYSRALDSAFGSQGAPEPEPAPEVVPDLPSPLEGVDDAAWTEFVRRMRVQGVGDVSRSNAVGMFAIMPRRLVDLGLASHLKRGKLRGGRTAYAAAFVPPLTSREFLGSPARQYDAFARSMVDYAGQLRGVDLCGSTLSGALAVLHRAGPRGMEALARGDLFPDTDVLRRRVEGLF